MIKQDQENGGTMTPQRSVISSSPPWLASGGDEIMPPFLLILLVIQTQFIKSASISLAIVEQLIFDVFLYVFMIQEGGSS